ncbi:13367_t:CDS:1 [Entrophospora sp. SA101]|nr:13367_t:CDS:1 [Entrophospora sp. SA101]
MPDKFLSIDPSGSGTTGCVFYDERKKTYQFFNFNSKNWQEHFHFLSQLCQEKKVNILVYENTNFIYGRQFAGSVNLLKLIGGIECLKHVCRTIKQVDNILVKQVKDFYKKVLQKNFIIPELERKIGRKGGWFFQGQKINIHELDALLGLNLYLLPPENKKKKKK